MNLIYRRIIPFLLIALVMVNGGANISAQERSKGLLIRVIDDETLQPLPGVLVHYGREGNVTNEEGNIELPQGLAENTMVSFSYIGYQKISLSIDKLRRSKGGVIHMTPITEALGEVVVTTEGNTTRRTAVGQSIGALTLGMQMGKNLGEAVQGVRGVSLISNGVSSSQPVIHGMYGERILILNNGVRHKSQQWGQGHAPEIALAQAGRVTVLKGAESVRYGADALGGVIIVEQASLPYTQEDIKGSTTLYGATNGLTYGVSGKVEKGMGHHLAWRVLGDYSNSGDKRTAQYLLNNTGQRQWSMLGQLGWRSTALEAELLISSLQEKEGTYFGAQMGNVDLLKERIEMGRPPQDVITPFTRKIDYGYHTTSHSLAKLKMGYTPNNHHRFEGMIAYQLNLRNEYHLRRNKLSHVPESALVLQNVEGEFLWHYTANKHLEVEIGILGTFTDNYNKPGTGVVPMIPNYVQGGWGVYTITKYHIDMWGVEIGIRGDGQRTEAVGIDYDGQNYGGIEHQNNLTYSIGGYAEIANGLTLRSQIGSAWRAPHVSELYSNGLDMERGIYMIGNKDLKSERVFKWVASLSYRNSWLHADIEGYLQWVNNYIYQEPTKAYRTLVSGTYPLFAIKQTSAALHGVDAEVTVYPFSWLSYTISSGMIWANEQSTGRYLPYMPPLHIREEIKGEWAVLGGKHKASISLQHKFVAKQKRFDPDTDLIKFAPPAYHLVGLNVSFTQGGIAKNSEITYQLSIENLFNKEYKEYTNLARYYAHDLGRNIQFSISYNF